jgi:hypothetical protein
MLATIAALQLVVLSQVAPPPREVTSDDVASEADAPAAEGAPSENAPLPRKAAARADAAAEPQPPPPSYEPAADAAGGAPTQLSLLSGEPLRGGSTALGWAGWSSLGVMYGQGITAQDDLAGLADFDWATTELRLGALWRRSLGRAGAFDVAGRLSAAWYLNFGGRLVHDENDSDRGFEVVPGLSLSRRGAGGIFSAMAEAPLTVTTEDSAGLLFSPRFSVAYEGPIYPELTIGARLGVGYRAGSGDAPLREGDAELLFLVLAGYQLL